MAKRYKKKKRNKIRLYLTCIVAICIMAFLIYNFFIEKENESKNMKEDMQDEQQLSHNINIKNEQTELEEASNENVHLNVDILKPIDLEKEVRNKLENKIGDAEILKVHYILKTLEEGTVLLYYKINDTNIYLVEVDIAYKEITDTKEVKDEELLQKLAIEDNLNEDVKQDFETYKERIVEENSRLNIIISNTEIIINISYV